MNDSRRDESNSDLPTCEADISEKILIEEVKVTNDVIYVDDAIKQTEVFDSFWVSSVRIGISEKSSIEMYENNEDIKSNRSEEKLVEHLPPICKLQEEVEEEVKEKLVDQEGKNPNDTDLDQTFNLNASYEIVPERNIFTESQIIGSYDNVNELVDKIIDCTKLDSDDELLQFLNEKNKSKEKLDDSLVSYDDDFVNEEEQIMFEDVAENDDNLTVLVPEQINKIKDEVEKHFDVITEEAQLDDLSDSKNIVPNELSFHNENVTINDKKLHVEENKLNKKVILNSRLK